MPPVCQRDDISSLITLQIAFFNFFGISVTKKLSGAARATIDATRTLFVWGFSVLMHWERFHALQVGGCAVGVSCTIMTKYGKLVQSAGLTTKELVNATSCEHDTGHWIHRAPGGHLDIQ